MTFDEKKEHLKQWVDKSAENIIDEIDNRERLKAYSVIATA